MRINQLRVLLAIVDSGSIHGGARELGVTQPAITKSLRQLEEELQVRLLDRTQHGVVVTPAGRMFVARARAVQSELRNAEEELAGFAGHRSGAVAFGITYVALPMLPDAFARFRVVFPDARVHIVEAVSHRLVPMLRDETVDFIVGRWTGGKSDPSMKVRPLLDHEMVITARADHPLARARSLSELLEADWAAVVAPGMPGSVIEQAFESAGLPCPRKLTRCESFAAVLALVAGTELLSILPKSIVATSVVRGRLVSLAIREPLAHQMISLITRGDARLTPAATAMTKAMTATARELARRN
jgi:LysR family transcriptional regulator, regulator of abg operon